MHIRVSQILGRGIRWNTFNKMKQICKVVCEWRLLTYPADKGSELPHPGGRGPVLILMQQPLQGGRRGEEVRMGEFLSERCSVITRYRSSAHALSFPGVWVAINRNWK